MGIKITTFDPTLAPSRWCEMDCKKVWKHMKQLGPDSININPNMTEYILKNSKKRIDIYVKDLHHSLLYLMKYEKVLNNMSRSDIENDRPMVTYIYKQNISIKRYIPYLDHEYYYNMDKSKVWKDMGDDDYNKNIPLTKYLINSCCIKSFRMIRRFIPNLDKVLWKHMDRDYIYDTTDLQEMNEYPDLLRHISRSNIPLKHLKRCRNLHPSLFKYVKCYRGKIDDFLFLFENNMPFYEYIVRTEGDERWIDYGSDPWTIFKLRIEKFHYDLPKTAWGSMNKRKVWKNMKGNVKKINHNIEFTKYVLNNDTKITSYHHDLHPDLLEDTSIIVWERFVNGKDIDYIESVLKRTCRKITHYNPMLDTRLFKYMDRDAVIKQIPMSDYRMREYFDNKDHGSS